MSIRILLALSFLRQDQKCISAAVRAVCTCGWGVVGRKGKVKGQCSVTVGEQRVDMKYPDLSRSGTTLFFGIDLSHNYSSSFGNEWLRFGCEKSTTSIADWCLFFSSAMRRK